MGYRVKKRWPLLGISIVIVFGSLVFWRCFVEPDSLGYNEILETANPSRSLEAKSYKAAQLRKGVQKVFWRREGLKAMLCCSEAELLFEKEGAQQDLLENMKDVRCFIQEELFYLTPEGSKTAQPAADTTPCQLVRCVEAETATYYYAKETLDAKQVTLRLYTLVGHTLPDTLPEEAPLSFGTADRVAITMADHVMHVDADRVKGKMERE